MTKVYWLSIDLFYVGQNYSRIPEQLIRGNAKFIVLLKQDNMSLHHAFCDHVYMGSYKVKESSAKVWNKDKHGFLVIDKKRDIDKGRYCMGMDSFVQAL